MLQRIDEEEKEYKEDGVDSGERTKMREEIDLTESRMALTFKVDVQKECVELPGLINTIECIENWEERITQYDSYRESNDAKL